MHFVLSALITVAFAFSAVAVDIHLFPFNDTIPCNKNAAFVTCPDLEPYFCCHLWGHDVFFASCEGLASRGDVCLMDGPADPSKPVLCERYCDYAEGEGTRCVGTGKCSIGNGAGWAGVGNPLPPSGEVLQTKCKKAVEPSRAVFANGQSFRVNYDVPADISALLIDLVRTDPHLSKGAPEGAAPYEIKAETEA